MAKKGSKVIGIEQLVNLDELVNDYLLTKKTQGVTKYTIINHKSALKHFFNDYKGKIGDSKKLKLAVSLFLTDRTNEYYNKLLQSLRQSLIIALGRGIKN